MFCGKCGRPTEGDKIICDECAAAMAAAKQPAPEAPAAPAAPAAPEAPAAPKAPEAPAFTVNTDTAFVPKKKKKGPVGWIIAAVVLVAVIVAAVLCCMITDMFNNDADVDDGTTEQNQPAMMSGSMVESAGAAYGAFLAGLQNPATTSDCTVTLNLGEDLVSLLQSTLTSQDVTVDVSWLESVALNLQTGMDSDSYGIDLGVGLNDTDILTLKVFMDITESVMYMGIPEVSDTYLSVAMTEEDMGFDPAILSTAMNAPKEMAATLAEELPSQEAFEAALEKYITLIAENLPEGEQEKESFEVKGISEELTVTTRKLTEKNAIDIVVAVLEAAKDDETVKQFITAVCDYTNSYNAMNAEMSGYEYISELNPSEIIAAIPDLIEELKDTDIDDSTITLALYTDAEGNLRGGSLEDPDGNLLFDCVSVSGDSGTALQIDLPEDIQIYGQSSNEKTDYELHVNGEMMLSVHAEVTSDGATLITLVPSAALLEELSYDYPVLGMVSSANPELQLKLLDDGMELNLMLNDKVFAGVGLTAGTGNTYAPAKPGSSISAEDQTALMTWLTELDFTDVLQSLRDADVPEEYVNLLQTLADQLSGAGTAVPDTELPNNEAVALPAA